MLVTTIWSAYDSLAFFQLWRHVPVSSRQTFVYQIIHLSGCISHTEVVEGSLKASCPLEDVCFARIAIGLPTSLLNDNDHIHWDNLRKLTICIIINLWQRKVPERQKTSFSLDGESTLTEDIVAAVRQASGSLSCLENYGLSGVPDMECGINCVLSQVHSESGSTIDDAPSSSRNVMSERTVTWAEPRIKVIPPTGARSALMAMHTEYTR